jgi:hypothetical protein
MIENCVNTQAVVFSLTAAATHLESWPVLKNRVFNTDRYVTERTWYILVRTEYVPE